MNLRKWKRSRVQFSKLEYLEGRSMLSGHALSSGCESAMNDAYVDAASTWSRSSTKAAVSSQSSSQELHLGAALADPNGTAKGWVSYELETEKGTSKTSFQVQVNGAQPSTTLDVAIDGVVVGQIATDVNGSGKLSLSSKPKGSQQPLPVDFPATLAAGAIVTAGTTTGTLAAGEAEHEDGGSQSTETHLRASLTDSNGTATGKVSYESETERGKTKSKMEIEIRGAVPGSVLDVSVDGTVVGQITVNSKGRGKLVLSGNPKSGQAPLPTNIAAGSIVSVGSLTGTLATPVKAKK